MKIKFIIPVYIWVTIICAGGVQAAFEDLLTSARPIGMAGAFTAVAEGPENAILNPAGLGSLKSRWTVGSSFSPAYVGLDDGSMYNLSASAGASFENIGGFALNFQYFNVNTLDVKNIYTENILGLSYGRVLKGRLSGGVTLKFMNWSAAAGTDPNSVSEQLSAYFFSADAGFFFRNPSGTSIGLIVCDFLHPDITSGRKAQRQPVSLKLGVAFKAGIFLIDFDTKYTGQVMDFAVGTETWLINQKLGLRAGMQFLDMISGMNFALGSSFHITEQLAAEYAFQYPLISVQKTWGTHVISVAYRY